MIGRQSQKLERLYLTYIDKLSVAETMRKNLASDIVAGYHIANVVKQMVDIEEYEKTNVYKAEKEYRDYQEELGITNSELMQLETTWNRPFCKTLKYCHVRSY